MVLTDTQLSLLGDCAPILTPEQIKKVLGAE